MSLQPEQNKKTRYTAALLVIGNEILSGRTQDKNINWVAVKLTERGITMLEVRVVPDVEARIIDSVRALSEAYDYVFTSGGIGPTHDDITAESMAKAFDAPLEKNAEAYEILERHYGKENLTSARLKMGLIPQSATLIPNPVSGAPGFIIRNVHVMAWVPKIMQAMLDHVLATLQGGAVVLSRTVTCDLPESRIAEGLAEIQNRWAEVDIGSYPHFQDGNFGVHDFGKRSPDDVVGEVSVSLTPRTSRDG